jgi:Rho guanine nucleotide exchange factor 7
MKNAFEISGPMIERIVAVCQGPSDANKWVDFLTNNGGTLTKTVDTLQRQRSDFELRRNASTTSAAVTIPQPPPHVSSRTSCFFCSFHPTVVVVI